MRLKYTIKKFFFRNTKVILFLFIFLVIFGFLLSQQFISRRIIVSTEMRLQQLQSINSNLLVQEIDAMKEYALLLALDNTIIKSFKLNPLLMRYRDFESISLIWPDGTIIDYAGRCPASLSYDQSIEKGQARVFFYCDPEHDSYLLLVAMASVQRGNGGRAELIITKVFTLNKAFHNTLLVTCGSIQSESTDASFLKPFVKETNKIFKFGRIRLSDKVIFALKMPIPGLNTKDTYLLLGLNKRQASADNRQILLIQGIVSALILFIACFALKVFINKLYKTQQELKLAYQQLEADRAKFKAEKKIIEKNLQHINEEKTNELEKTIMSLKTAQAELLHSEKLASIGQLAAGIAHEINTPTQYVGDNTAFLQDVFKDILDLIEKFHELLSHCRSGDVSPQLIEEIEESWKKTDVEFLSKEIPQAIEQALEGLSRVSRIVQAMKEFAYVSPSEKTVIDINRAIESTITVARNEWKYVAEMKTDLDLSIPEIPCFPGDFNQVILNLIVNAAHAIEEVVGDGSQGKGTISISTYRDNDSVVIKVSDTGKGVPTQIQSLIFDPFFTTKEVGKGSGQGLAIARSVIMEKHGGTITLDTSSDNKTTFIINLPLNDDMDTEVKKEEEKGTERAYDPQKLQREAKRKG
ncbi:MAG: sensor histidine kinase [bacterium]